MLLLHKHNIGKSSYDSLTNSDDDRGYRFEFNGCYDTLQITKYHNIVYTAKDAESCITVKTSMVQARRYF